jgi:hypothetical protein
MTSRFQMPAPGWASRAPDRPSPNRHEERKGPPERFADGLEARTLEELRRRGSGRERSPARFVNDAPRHAHREWSSG